MLFHGLVFKPWRIWTRRPLWLKTLLGMLTGIGLGLCFSEQALLLKPIGVLFVNTIQMLMVPLIVSIHRNSIDTGKMRRSSLDPTFLLA
ncbi:hypothetical protein WP2W18C05_02160 [Aeromonas sp. WP2-W18-CRE-05]|nr:hypothetical protein WP2W18C05_02160 [Aeromonas sp. WP2-W18-CRE-05]